MARATRQRHLPDRTPHVRPVERIETNERRLGLRFALFAAALVAGLLLLSQGMKGLLRPQPGWQEITASAREPGAAAYFTLYANVSTSAQQRQLTALYEKASREAYQLFEAPEPNGSNLAQVNAHPGEAVQVAPALYRALEQLGESRALYLAPLYAERRSLFYAQEDYEASQVDPLLDADARAFHEAAMAYVRDASHVRLELLGDDTVRLCVSDAYAAFAQANGVREYLDFFWMKNAFEADYLAEALAQGGFHQAVISSRDGFARILGAEEGGFALVLQGRRAGRRVSLAQARCGGNASVVCLSDAPLGPQSEGLYYVYANGECRLPYLDGEDGQTHAALPQLVAASRTESCAQVLLKAAPLYIREEWDASQAEASGLTLLYGGEDGSLTQLGDPIFQLLPSPSP